MTAYTDYVYNLDKLTIYVTNKPVEDADELHGKSKCASVTRLNNALFNPRLHFDCPEPLEGRYLYVKASGVPNRWRRLFTVVLCEVMVYWRNVRKSQRFWSIFFTSLVCRKKTPFIFMEKNDIEKVICHPHRKQMSDRNKSCHNLLSIFFLFFFFLVKSWEL